MTSLARFRICFTPSWQMSLCTALAFSCLMILGFWQMERGSEKRALIHTATQAVKQPFKVWSGENPLPSPYQQVIIKGQFLQNVFFLDNQYHRHAVGYHVISPLLLNNQRIVLVDRGWIKAGNDRNRLPHVATVQNVVQIKGQAYYPSAKFVLLGPLLENQKANAAVIEAIDIAFFSQFLHKSVYPFIIRLNNEAEGGFVRQWPIVSMPPERHYAYAMQWFIMALIVLILFIRLNLRRISH